MPLMSTVLLLSSLPRSNFFTLLFSHAACSLINNDMKQFIISSETDEIRKVESRVRLSKSLYVCSMAKLFCSGCLVVKLLLYFMIREIQWRLLAL